MLTHTYMVPLLGCPKEETITNWRNCPTINLDVDSGVSWRVSASRGGLLLGLARCEHGRAQTLLLVVGPELGDPAVAHKRG